MENFIKIKNKKKTELLKNPKQDQSESRKREGIKNSVKKNYNFEKNTKEKENEKEKEREREKEKEFSNPPCAIKINKNIKEEKAEKKEENTEKAEEKTKERAENYNPYLLKFHTRWILYDHMKSEQFDYDDCTRFVASFDNVSDLWSLLNNLPKPSDLFYQKEIGKPHYLIENDEVREVSSISMFREGISPKWEDALNRDGGELALKKFFYTKNIIPIEYVDSLWLKLILNVIGEQFSNSTNITGIRVVDTYNTNPLKSSDKNRPLYRLELWFTDNNYKDIYENEIRKCLDLSQNDKIIFKSHDYNIKNLENENNT
jgi:translation initiation factor 4E